MMDLGTLLAGVLGLSVGSFLNVCIARLPRGESIFSPPSHCTACGLRIRWYDNVPILAYVWLRGRCRQCGSRFSVMYPLVELLSGFMFVAAYGYYGPSVLLVSRLLFACAMIVLFVIDLQHRILPNVITLPGVAVGFAFSVFTEPGWVASLVGVLGGGGVLLAVSEIYLRVRGEEGLGMGDVKMLGMIGAFLGWKLMLLTLVLSSFLGSVVGVAMIVAKKGDLKYALPFGTFLAVAALFASVMGEPIVRWYLSLY
ncbi:MAG: prepilin peptidase [Acidobacteria bacterium]|nr:prepilin peptidase [Acidobacteriota bacterium]MBI3262886.1 prepilin peptidase [Acidobacteriota bacterium]